MIRIFAGALCADSAAEVRRLNGARKSSNSAEEISGHPVEERRIGCWIAQRRLAINSIPAARTLSTHPEVPARLDQTHGPALAAQQCSPPSFAPLPPAEWPPVALVLRCQERRPAQENEPAAAWPAKWPYQAPVRPPCSQYLQARETALSRWPERQRPGGPVGGCHGGSGRAPAPVPRLLLLR